MAHQRSYATTRVVISATTFTDNESVIVSRAWPIRRAGDEALAVYFGSSGSNTWWLRRYSSPGTMRRPEGHELSNFELIRDTHLRLPDLGLDSTELERR